MRTALLVVAVALPALAFAADKTKPADIEKLVKQHVLALAKDKTDDQLALAKDRLLVGPSLEFKAGTPVVTTFREGINGPLTHKPGKVAIGIDDEKGLAYFQVTVDATIKVPGEVFKSVDRVGGIAVRNGASWEFAALMYSRDLDVDAKVISRAQEIAAPLPTGEPTITGDAALGATVRGWFKTGFASSATKVGTPIASGTAPREFQTKAGALKLAKAWDKLGLGLSSIHVTKLAGDSVAFVKAEVVWPAKKNKLPVNVPLLLGMVLVQEGSEWRWVSMQFAPI